MISDALVDQRSAARPLFAHRHRVRPVQGRGVHGGAFRHLGHIDLPDIARSVIGPVGYRPEDFNATDCTVVTSIITMPTSNGPRSMKKT